MNKLLVVGDVHSNLEALYTLINEVKNQIVAVLQVGDFELFQSNSAIKQELKYLKKLDKTHSAKNLKKRLLKKEMEPFPIPVYYIKGNHEDFENLETDALSHLNIHYMPQGSITNVNGRLVGAIGGIHSPVKRTAKSSSLVGHDRRFYTTEEVTKLLSNSKSSQVEIMLTHQAVSGIIPTDTPDKRHPWEEGTKDFVDLLKMPKLRYYIHGHHHVNYSIKMNNDALQCVGLGNFGKNKDSYKII